MLLFELNEKHEVTLTSVEKYEGSNVEIEYWGEEDSEDEPTPPQYVWEIWQGSKYVPLKLETAEVFEKEFWKAKRKDIKNHTFFIHPKSATQKVTILGFKQGVVAIQVNMSNNTEREVRRWKDWRKTEEAQGG